MKISFFEIKDWEIDYLTARLEGHSLKFFKDPLTKENVSEISDTEIISVFIYSKITEELLSHLPNLKFIATRSTGFDHVDLDACTKHQIFVSNVPYYGENTIAEHTFGLILALSRNIHKSYLRTIRNDFSIEGLKGFDLKGKTLGVVGAGHIGLHVIRVAKAFGMTVLVFDIEEDRFLAEVLGFSYVSFENLLEGSDIISLHVPYNKHTHHLINKDNIHLIKKGAILINTARGGVVDTDALLEALDQGILSGAGLDVLEGEELFLEDKRMVYNPSDLEAMTKLVKDHILLSRDNVVFTPHIAFYSQEALERILDTTIENISFFCSGSEFNIVN
ncbi:MAG: hydroxyacid dehydrogenase [Candidatus Heimdallarchaeota archaeon]|nr:MAG: hydroxyacid dehydrogenase [Candidatus Heimdallarchaeota archaeon]